MILIAYPCLELSVSVYGERHLLLSRTEKETTLGPKYFVERRQVYRITKEILLFIHYFNKYLWGAHLWGLCFFFLEIQNFI